MDSEKKMEGVEQSASEEQQKVQTITKKESAELAISMQSEINALTYRPASEKCQTLGSATPTKLYYEIQYALSQMKDLGIDTTDYVREKLGYNSTLAVCNAFKAEQVDAIALAIFQIENGYSFILGDGTGIGKGRTCAGLLRYAYQKGMIPVFITFKSSLFSSIYRDIIDIGGFDSSNTIPKPFFLLGQGSWTNKKEYKSGQSQEKVYKNDVLVNGRVLFNANRDFDLLKDAEKAKAKRAKEKGKPFVPTLPTKADDWRVSTLEKGKLPAEYGLILGQYSGFSRSTEVSRRVKSICDFITKNADKTLIVFDECHAAAGKGVSNQNINIIKKTSAKILFSSATFAKTVSNLSFYVSRTAIADAGVEEDKINDFVNEFKDNALEFISQGVAESGQMIRREKTLEGCEMDFAYERDEIKVNEQFEKYDLMVGILREIKDFYKSDLYKTALVALVQEVAYENKIKLPETKCPKGRKDAKKWREEWGDKGFFQYSVDFGRTVKNRNSWIEALLFSLKVELVASEVIRRLKVKSKYEQRIGKESEKVETYTKPLISLRNTGDSLLKTLGKKDGDVLTEEEQDFSFTLIKVLEDCLVGTIKFTEILADTDSDSEGEEEEGREPEVIEVTGVQLSLDKFFDNGARYFEIMQTIKSTKSGLPISPIDKLIELVSAQKRNADDFEFATSEKFVIEDTTSRKLSIVNENGKYVFRNRATGNNVVKIQNFNSGKCDAIIINVSASTGESFHSSSLFRDKRRRTMIIHQVELDVSTEQQKMGRVNRTGQINLPEYCYIISSIPSEVRRLMALRRKLRSLSANTTGNMNQAAEQSEILDRNGNPIEDIFNKYGFQVIRDYCNDHPPFMDYVSDYGEWSKTEGDLNLKVDEFTLGLELASSKDQRDFYDAVNQSFILLRQDLLKKDEWDLDSNIVNYKASLKNRAIIFEDTGENAFKSPVFENDIYVSSLQEPYSNEKIQEEIEKGTGGKPEEYQIDFVQKTIDYKNQYIESELSKMSFYVPNEGEELPKEYKDENEAKKKGLELRVSENYDWFIDMINLKKTQETKRKRIEEDEEEKRSGKRNDFKTTIHKCLEIGQPCIVPFDMRKLVELYDQLEAEKSRDYPRASEIETIEFLINSQQVVVAKLIAIRNDSKEGKYNPSNIKFVFACLDGLEVQLTISPTKTNRDIFRFIYKKTKEIDTIQRAKAEAWVIDFKPRIIIKSITGNLLRAYDTYIRKARPTDRLKICSYTNLDGSIEKGIIITNPTGITEIGGRDFINPYDGRVSIKGDFVNGDADCKFEKLREGQSVFINTTRFVVNEILGNRKLKVLMNPTNYDAEFAIMYPSVEHVKYVPINDDEVLSRDSETFFISDGMSVIDRGKLKVLLGFKGGKSSDFSKYEDQIILFCNKNKILCEKLLVEKFTYFDYKSMKISVYTPQKKQVPILKAAYTKELADFIYEISKLTIPIGSKTEFSQKEDEFKPIDKESMPEAKEGIYSYKVTTFGMEEDKVPYKLVRGFVSFTKSSTYPTGVIVYKYELTAAEAMAEKLIPLEPNYDSAFSQLVTLLKKNRKVEQFYKFVNDYKENPSAIYMEAKESTRVADLKYLFGDMNNVRIGQIIIAKVLTTEMPKEEPKKESKKEEKLEVFLNLDTAQDFLIKFAE